ncbi:putative leucine-rich repeat domain, L domain-containing protein [Medicago truncatula]|uniref:Putative leucine-rich repeat domain, L domain-containing protein n=1 Tax=Medicago truncatula TaxID=3880 RepID=A0A396GWR2_MEDTR|nr:putative leucine-rich repeat domain, L domain-containing protein [Medicago truncatula]
MQCAVQTCILSKRWNNLWKHLPTLILKTSHFTSMTSFNKFVSRILSLRNAKSSLRILHFERDGTVQHRLLQRMVKYAVSHNVQQLSINPISDIQHFPTCFFSCRTLTYLKLALIHPTNYMGTLFPISLDLPALATLSLESFIFPVGDDGCVDPFSAFSSLNSLIIRYCRVLGQQNLCISSATLDDLTIEKHNKYDKIELSTPSLCTFVFVCEGNIPALKLHGIERNLSSVKHVKIDVSILGSIVVDTSLALLNWLVELANIKSLTINHNALEVEFHSLCNLKSLRVKMRTPSSISNGTLYFLLQNSPSAKVEIIDC